MNDPFAAEYIVRDIALETGEWRWAFQHPELKLTPQAAKHQKFTMDFLIPAVTFEETGPVNVTCFLDGKPLGSMHIPAPGKYRYEKPVPEGWIQPGVPVSITAETDKQYIAKADGARLSFLLGAAGFTE
jgi:hypothetical protein